MKPRRTILLMILGGLCLASLAVVLARRDRTGVRPGNGERTKLYWFIPDGLRAAGAPLDLFELARRGILPNLARMMAEGTYGYSIPAFPTHTPVGHACLATGVYPDRHGVADGPMRLPGYPLDFVSLGGFSSYAKQIEPLWYTLENRGYHPAVLSFPGSTPPELTHGTTVRGRWGGWGADFHSISYVSSEDLLLERSGWDERVFQYGAPLLQRVGLAREADGSRYAEFDFWDTRYALRIPRTAEGTYPEAVFLELASGAEVARLQPGRWSVWHPAGLQWRTQDERRLDIPQRQAFELALTSVSVDARLRIFLDRIDARGEVKFRLVVENLNPFVVAPSELAEELRGAIVPPMVDFPDNYPPQLVHDEGDRLAFLEEQAMSFAWHRAAARRFAADPAYDAVLHGIYTPNQMLTSRWWLPAIDPSSDQVASTPPSDRAARLEEVLAMYREVDGMLGDIREALPKDALVVLSSDHGILPLNREVRLNNLLHREGLLAVKSTGDVRATAVDFAATRAVFLKMYHLYLAPEGLGGNWHRPRGAEYEALRARIRELLSALRDEDGTAPLRKVLTWEEASKELHLPNDRIGDLVLVVAPGYSLVEELSEDGALFVRTLKGGYKQAALAEDDPRLWTPFVLVGPGVARGRPLSRPVADVDQYPTVVRLLGLEPPYRPDGSAVEEVFEQAALDQNTAEVER